MKKNQLLTQKQLVDLTGLTHPEISRILNGKRRATPRQARLLSRTGFSELTWLYPEDYPGNPYLPENNKK